MSDAKVIYGLVGAGGHGRESMLSLKEQLMRTRGDLDVSLYFVDSNPPAPRIDGIECISMEAFCQMDGQKYFNIAISDGRIRRRLAERLEQYGTPLPVAADGVRLGEHNAIHPTYLMNSYALITTNVSVGRYFHANIYASVAHDCIVGDFVTLGPKATVNGNVIIEDHAYIGSGALIKQGAPENKLTIGEGAIVGMGAVVTRSVPAGVTVIGNPARPLGR